MAAKTLMPSFGGAQAVWLVAMVFFQLLLLGGYYYAHRISHWAPRKQAAIHLGLAALALASAFVPRMAVDWSTMPPALGVLGALGLWVGLPYLAVAPGAPMLQRWYAASGKRPYHLYAASNFGSFLALPAYPLLIEPNLTLEQQFLFWRVGFVVLAVLWVACGLSAPKEHVETEKSAPTTKNQRLLWIALAAAPSALLLGVTGAITTNIASVPLLWVVPLGLYLLTYSLGFMAKPILSVSLLARFLPLIATPLVIPIVLESTEPPSILIFHLIPFFLAAWMCHGRLAETAPPADRATEFFVWIALGGALGGAAVSLVAPHVFSKFTEYPIALVAVCLLRPLSKPFVKLDIAWALAVLLVAYVAGWGASRYVPLGGMQTALNLGLPLLLAFVAIDRPVRYALSLGAVFLGANLAGVGVGGQILEMRRSFFGVHRVVRAGTYHRLIHGNIIHGSQDMRRPDEPLTYYHRTGPIGQVFEAYGDRLKRVGLVGLGSGSLATYARLGMDMVFFEIDAEVVEVAKTPRLFSYVSNAQGPVEMRVADGRLGIAKDTGKFDLIVLDAFSSDSIPMHLLTLEAIDTYLGHLSEGGVIAFHTSNRYLSLKGILAGAADQKGLKVRYQFNGDDDLPGKTASEWILLAKDDAAFAPLERSSEWDRSIDYKARPWTDDYSNIFQAILARMRPESP